MPPTIDGARDGDGQRRVLSVGRRRAVLIDSITQVREEDAGAIVVSGSHGGTSSGRYAATVPAALYAFNDAGVGKDRAGIAALADLDALGIAAVAVGHDTAAIGSARETWEGTVRHVNEAARAMGARVGTVLREAL